MALTASQQLEYNRLVSLRKKLAGRLRRAHRQAREGKAVGMRFLEQYAKVAYLGQTTFPNPERRAALEKLSAQLDKALKSVSELPDAQDIAQDIRNKQKDILALAQHARF